MCFIYVGRLHYEFAICRISFSRDGVGDVSEVDSTELISVKQSAPIEKKLKRKVAITSSDTEVSE